MSKIISKELLSEVLKEEIVNVHDHISDQHVSYSYKSESNDKFGLMSEINIHELAHECKEWAYDEGYWIFSYKSTANDGRYMVEFGLNDSKYRNDRTITDIAYPTEFKAIEVVCQWILNER